MAFALNRPLAIGDIFTRLTEGDFGLAKTFWIFGLLIPFTVNVAIGSLLPVQWVDFLWIAYGIPLLVGLWRAADNYQGLIVWVVLARCYVALSGLGYLFMILGSVGLIG